jgi:hypothetical protein
MDAAYVPVRLKITSVTTVAQKGTWAPANCERRARVIGIMSRM